MGFISNMIDVIKNMRNKPATEPESVPVDDPYAPFVGPLKKMPSSMQEVYQIYGRPEKETDTHQTYPVAKMRTVANLPGDWNSGSGRLYMLAYMEDYVREALRRCELIGALGYIERMGCYNYRHQRYDDSLPLSYHSWGCALDINGADNGTMYKKNMEMDRPFSDRWKKRWPKGVPEEMVKVFKAVGFTWGGDWGVSWDKFKWVSFYDPMHFELVSR